MRPWELLLRNVNVLHSVLEKAEPELSLLELDTKRLFILCMVDANAFPADLARVLSMPKPSMTFLIKKLEESGYLRRQGEKGDLRRYRLTITPAGIKARDKGAEAVNRIFGACLNSLSAADQATLSRLETGRQPNPTVDTLWRYASAVGRQLLLTHGDPAATNPRNGTPVSSSSIGIAGCFPRSHHYCLARR